MVSLLTLARGHVLQGVAQLQTTLMGPPDPAATRNGKRPDTDTSAPPASTHVRWLRRLAPNLMSQIEAPPKTLHSTAWLDGLRGLAALSVLNVHMSFLFLNERVRKPWGQGLEDDCFIQWPFIRLLLVGTAPVSLFFIVSGYALSFKPLKLARQGRHAEFGSALSSLIFRRHMRLYMPAMAVTFVIAVMSWLKFFGIEEPAPHWFPRRVPPRGPNFIRHWLDWAFSMAKFVEPFPGENQNHSNAYEGHMWTIPPEFATSLFIFVCLAALSRIRPRPRLFITFGMMVYAHYLSHWVPYLFVTGMFLCDLKFHQEASASTQPKSDNSVAATDSNSLPKHNHTSSTDNERALNQKLPWYIGFVVALYLLSYPEYGLWSRKHVDVPGWVFLDSIVPGVYTEIDHFWITIGATLAMFIIDRVPLFQRIFTGFIPQYLGKISYSMYLVHGSVIWSLGRCFKVWAVLLLGGTESPLAGKGAMIAMVVTYPVVFVIGDLTTEYVDKPSVAFARRLFDSLLADHAQG